MKYLILSVLLVSCSTTPTPLLEFTCKVTSGSTVLTFTGLYKDLDTAISRAERVSHALRNQPKNLSEVSCREGKI